jgi:ActR/RegA family two-component response regulator
VEKPLILLMDDDPLIHKAIPLLLKSEFDVIRAWTTQEAVEQIQTAEKYVDIAVVDMWLGDDKEGGLKAIQQIRALDFPPEIIVLTAYPSSENMVKCMEAGAFSYVEKTGEIGEYKTPLIETIHRALDARKLKVTIAPEAITVVDIVESTGISSIFGWYAVGRTLIRDLRTLIMSIGKGHGLRCIKSTGDGYLLAYDDPDSRSAELSVVHAVEATFELLDQLATRNKKVREEQAINVRLAIHFGQVDVIEGDREGPEVSFAFRLEGVDKNALATTRNRKIEPEAFPSENYALCSQQVARIIEKRCHDSFSTFLVGNFELKGFTGSHEVYLISRQSNQESHH